MANADRQEFLCYSFAARHSRNTRSQFLPQPNNAGWRVLAALARVRAFLEFRPPRLWSDSKREGKRSRKQIPLTSRPRCGRVRNDNAEAKAKSEEGKQRLPAVKAAAT